jgi:cytochrome c oxidase cbb3-type subunit 1
LAGFVTVANSFTFLRRTTQFTLFNVALDQMTLLGFFTLAMLGALYEIAPCLVRTPWPAPRWVKLHFAVATLAAVVIAVAFGAGGVVQGLAINDATLPYFAVVKRYLPFAATGTLAWLLVLVGALLLALNFARLVAVHCRQTCIPALKGWFRAESVPSEVKA